MAACARRAVQRRRDCCVCCETGLPKGGEEGLLLECGVFGSARMRGQRFLRFDAVKQTGKEYIPHTYPYILLQYFGERDERGEAGRCDVGPLLCLLSVSSLVLLDRCLSVLTAMSVCDR